MGEPSRPLGAVGREVWDSFAGSVDDEARLLVYCETLDEREILRRSVLRGEGGASDRRALRQVESRLDDLSEQVARDRDWATFARRLR